MDDRDAKTHGFDDAAEMFKLVASADISTPSALSAFEEWKANDGTKEGLATPTKFLVMYSGGLTSWAAARRIADQHGTDNLRLLFADTIIEDEDLYRFLIESAADIFGIERLAIDGILCLIANLTLIEDEADGALERRKAQLTEIRDATAVIIPRLSWIADGRTPWEVFRDHRFIGNTRVDKCSETLKRKLMDKWRDAHYSSTNVTLVFGLDWSERHRITRHQSWVKPWNAVYPLDEKPYLTKDDIRIELESRGVRQPRLYDMGFPHNNCGGMCVKAGLAQWRHFYHVLPERFLYHEAEERKSIAAIGGNARSVLKLRDGGRTRPITLEKFRETIERQPNLYAEHGWGCGGGCAIDSEETQESEGASNGPRSRPPETHHDRGTQPEDR